MCDVAPFPSSKRSTQLAGVVQTLFSTSCYTCAAPRTADPTNTAMGCGESVPHKTKMLQYANQYELVSSPPLQDLRVVLDAPCMYSARKTCSNKAIKADCVFSPVLVEAALDLVAEVLCPDCVECAQTPGRLHVAHNAHNDHGRRLNQGHSLSCLLLVQLGAWLVHITHNVCHSSLVAHEGCEVWGLGLVILGEGLDLALATPAALLGQETQRTVAGVCMNNSQLSGWLLPQDGQPSTQRRHTQRAPCCQSSAICSAGVQDWLGLWRLAALNNNNSSRQCVALTFELPVRHGEHAPDTLPPNLTCYSTRKRPATKGGFGQRCPMR